MRAQILRITGLSVYLLGAVIWLIGGARSVFTNTSIERVKVDEITGLEFTVYEDGWEPGIEYIAAGFLGFSLTAAGAVFVESRKRI